MFIPAFLKAEYFRSIGDNGGRDFHVVFRLFFLALKLPESFMIKAPSPSRLFENCCDLNLEYDKTIIIFNQ